MTWIKMRKGAMEIYFTWESFLNTLFFLRGHRGLMGALFGVFLIQMGVDRFYHNHPCSLFPNIHGPSSRGGRHKSAPLRDYTLLKAYDPGWMESRAVKGATGKTPARLEWLWLTLRPHSEPHSEPYKQVYDWSPATMFDCWWSKPSSVLYIKFKGRVVLYL